MDTHVRIGKESSIKTEDGLNDRHGGDVSVLRGIPSWKYCELSARGTNCRSWYLLRATLLRRTISSSASWPRNWSKETTRYPTSDEIRERMCDEEGGRGGAYEYMRKW